MSESKLIHLAADLSHYHTDYLWKMPGSWTGYPYYSSPEFYEDIARTASRGIMDLLFFGDSGGTPEDYGGNHHAAVRYGAKWPRHDMMPMIPCMARVADGVGFGITMSTTYHHPFHIARTVTGFAVASGPAGHHSGGTVGTGHGPCRSLRRFAIQHTPNPAEHEGASGGPRCQARQIRPQVARLRDPLGGADTGGGVGSQSAGNGTALPRHDSPGGWVDRTIVDVRPRLLPVSSRHAAFRRRG